MHRHLIAISLLVLLAGTAVAARPTPMRAQATPAGAPPAAVTKEILGQGTSAVAPDRVLLLQRRTFAPGADSGSHPAPGPVVLVVESGTIAFVVSEGTAQATRGGTTEDVVAGGEVELGPGDSVFYDEGVVHTVRNVGADTAVTVEARLNPVEPATATPGP